MRWRKTFMDTLTRRRTWSWDGRTCNAPAEKSTLTYSCCSYDESVELMLAHVVEQCHPHKQLQVLSEASAMDVRSASPPSTEFGIHSGEFFLDSSMRSVDVGRCFFLSRCRCYCSFMAINSLLYPIALLVASALARDSALVTAAAAGVLPHYQEHSEQVEGTADVNTMHTHSFDAVCVTRNVSAARNEEGESCALLYACKRVL